MLLQDPINGAQQAGSWAVRETFVAVVTSNLPMIGPFTARLFHPIIGSLRSLSTSSNKLSKLSRSGDIKAGAFKLEDKNPRRGMGPRSVNPIPDYSLNGSNEQIYIRHDMTGHDTDLESGHATNSKNGGIVKQTSVEVTAARKSHVRGSTDEEDIGDYYLIQQSRREADRLGRKTSDKKQKRSSGFGIGRGL